ncbi:hypothetical protein LCV60_002663 [Escherichia coli]|nr:hypothetical protein [Escherichia coli]
MSKKLGFALSGLMLAMVAGTASADMDGGQLNISGLVVDNTCETRVDGVNIALHNIDGSTIKQVQINNPGDVYTKALDATTKSAVYDFKASYVRAVADQTATAGYVKTNTAYTITYQ